MEKNGGANGGGGCCKMSNNGDDGQPIKRFTPPGFIEYNPDTQLIFPPALRKHEFKPLAFGNKHKKWYRPVTLQQLLEIKKTLPSAKIIGGSTETQIEVTFKNVQYSASVFVGDIPELREYHFNDDHLEVGGNVTLTDLENIMKDAVKVYGARRGQPFAAILKQLQYFAGRQIRNVGTPAGNLATASPISDLNPVLVAANAVLVAKSLDKTTEIPMTKFFKAYRTTALLPDAVIAYLRIPVAKEKGEFLKAYKQAKRKDDDIAIVTCALRVALSDTFNVESVTLAYGGMAPLTVAAKKTAEYLIGKQWTHPETLEGAMNALEQDFDLRFGVPGGMATYRKSLALGFFYKFFHETISQLDESEMKADTQVLGEIEREISYGKRDHDAALKYAKTVIGKDAPHVAAMKQTTGEAQYTDDIPVHKNELYGYLVLSTKAHARILNVDPSGALDMPGVVDYVSYQDLPSEKDNWWGAPNCDEQFFATEKVNTIGQPIGIILADSSKHAKAAANLVMVEYEEMPAILTIEEAIEHDSYFQYYRYIRKGDAAKAFKECDHVFDGVVRMGGQEHFYLETNACVAVPKPEDGEMEIWSSTQNPSET